ncbi:ABC transporter substrate-binding protein [Paucibacter sp. JuS9]|uniref:ABC transporter substrate-binding protein n=1 Tax=Paucibacter sp. JuS9 TaxID=3228748 RepID=UPI00375695F7
MESVKLRLAWVPDMAEVGVFVAKEMGYFERENLDVTIEPGGFGLDPIKLVATGSSDFGVGGAGNLLLARAQGVPVMAVAAEFQDTPVGFVTRTAGEITSFKQFKGKRVGVQTGADTDVLYRALLVRNNMTSASVREVPIQYDMTPFLRGTIDVLPAYVTNQPVTLAAQGVKINVITAQSEGLRYYGNVFFVTESRLKNHPEQVRRFVRALRAGWEHALSNKADAIAALQKHTKDFDPKDLDAIYDRVVPFIRGDGTSAALLSMTEDRWKSTENVLRDAGLLKPGAATGKPYTTDFLR